MFKNFSLVLSLALVSACCVLTTACQKPSHSSTYRMIDQYERFPDISYEDLAEAIHSKAAVIIDANSPRSYTNGHIPGAISFFQNQSNIFKLLPKDLSAEIICYCGGPQCMSWKQAADLLHEAGYTNIKHFSAGIKGWIAEGGKLVK